MTTTIQRDSFLPETSLQGSFGKKSSQENTKLPPNVTTEKTEQDSKGPRPLSSVSSTSAYLEFLQHQVETTNIDEEKAKDGEDSFNSLYSLSMSKKEWTHSTPSLGCSQPNEIIYQVQQQAPAPCTTYYQLAIYRGNKCVLRDWPKRRFSQPVGPSCHPGETKVTFKQYVDGELKDMVVAVFGLVLYEQTLDLVKALMGKESR